MTDIPFLDLGEVESHLAIGEGFLIQVAAVSSDEGRHIISYNWGQNAIHTVKVYNCTCEITAFSPLCDLLVKT